MEEESPQIPDEDIWGTALAVLAEVPDLEWLSVKELAQTTVDAFEMTGPVSPKPGRVSVLLRTKMIAFRKSHPELLRRRSPARRWLCATNRRHLMGGWYTMYLWVGPSLDKWENDAYPMPRQAGDSTNQKEQL